VVWSDKGRWENSFRSHGPKGKSTKLSGHLPKQALYICECGTALCGTCHSGEDEAEESGRGWLLP